MSAELRFRKAFAKLVHRAPKDAPEPLAETLAAFQLVLHRPVVADSALFVDVAMDSLDLVEVTFLLDDVFGKEFDWEALWEAAGNRYALHQEPVLTPQIIADYVTNELRTAHS